MIETYAIANTSLLPTDVKNNGTVTVVALDVRNSETVAIDCVLSGLTGGTAPTVQFSVERASVDGTTWVLVNAATALSANGVSSFYIGPGMVLNQTTGRQLRVRATTTGGPTTANAVVMAFGDRYN
jgi:hypothetical protein